MIHRFLLFLASLAAALVLALGIAATGMLPIGSSSVAGPVAATNAPQPEPSVQVDTVYLTPPVAPQEVTITQTVQGHGDNENEHEGRGDD
jgi:hypothetical protein